MTLDLGNPDISFKVEYWYWESKRIRNALANGNDGIVTDKMILMSCYQLVNAYDQLIAFIKQYPLKPTADVAFVTKSDEAVHKYAELCKNNKQDRQSVYDVMYISIKRSVDEHVSAYDFSALTGSEINDNIINNIYCYEQEVKRINEFEYSDPICVCKMKVSQMKETYQLFFQNLEKFPIVDTSREDVRVKELHTVEERIKNFDDATSQFGSHFNWLMHAISLWLREEMNVRHIELRDSRIITLDELHELATKHLPNGDQLVFEPFFGNNQGFSAKNDYYNVGFHFSGWNARFRISDYHVASKVLSDVEMKHGLPTKAYVEHFFKSIESRVHRQLQALHKDLLNFMGEK